MDIKTFKTLASKLPAHIAVLMRGPTGVGKSHMGKALADELDLAFLDVRGSTMDESQVSGIPDFETSKTAGVATFCLPSWYVRACREPVVLMLDELNRSMPQVMQSFFQIVLDRELGNNVDGKPLRLHPETRVIAAVNHGNEYDVADMDPALLRRFWVVDLEPTVTDWIDWAGENDIDPVTIDFVRQHPEHFRVDPGSVEPGTVIPTPASWHRLDESLRHMGLAPSEVAGGRPEGFYALSTGFIGMEAAISYADFVARYERVISAEDVMAGKVDKETAEGLNASEAMAVLDKLANNCKDNAWKKKEAKNITTFVQARGGEQLVYFWNAISRTQNLANIQLIHGEIGQEVVKLVREARGLSN
tara:strand:+ start:1873 stop:2955 length:1083 start_codon:yes stop_codon:yes gene_type:complete